MIDNLLRYVQLKAFSRGFRGSHTAWLVVGAAAWMIIRARHQDLVIYRTKLEPGEQLVVTSAKPGAIEPPDR